MTLLGIETRRWLARRLTFAMALVVVGAALLTGILVFVNHSATDPEALAQARAQGQVFYERCVDDLTFGRDERSREQTCREAADRFEQSGDDSLRLTQVRNVMYGTTVPLAALALVLGASFIGAEWRANTVAAQLTWEPRRVRLLLTKAVVAIGMSAAFFVAAQALIAFVLMPTVWFRGTALGTDASWWWGTVGVVARGGTLAGMAAGVGFAFATVGRNTAAALGIMFGYLAVVESLLRGLIEQVGPWTVITNAIVFVGDFTSEEFFDRTTLAGGLTLAAYTVALLGIAAAWFSSRDVT